MLLRATENALAGHIWPAGRYLHTPDLDGGSKAGFYCIVRDAFDPSKRTGDDDAPRGSVSFILFLHALRVYAE